ncbi:peptidylprolyl isomerase [Paenibacillus lentus]|uniref:peptidylprolyl isomerase n=1 Tax=Paenibacillus lentus TaxID=1338368 RepID=A0A3Q8S6H3_9BACL|nr:peptidyl-prolyl cis-trans isomerase [Paenibacillus lentus]AZK48340.1 peptidylprolyl isomerase [Paenibacillus lentus]
MEDKDKKELESQGKKNEAGSAQESSSQETAAAEKAGSAAETVIDAEATLTDEASVNTDLADKVDAEADTETDTETDTEADTEAASGTEAEAHEKAATEVRAEKNISAGGQAFPQFDSTPPPSSGSSNIWPIISLVLAAVLVIVLVLPLVGGKKDVVATVNGAKITQDELYNELVKAGGGEQAKQALEAMIRKMLIKQEAKKKNIVVSEEDIQSEIDNYVKSFGSLEILEQMLQQYGMTLDDLKQDAELNVMVSKLLKDKTNVTDEEVKEIFETYKESFNTPEQVRTSVILVETEEEANEVIQQLKDGKDFAELAQDKSLDTFTRELGGDTGFFGRGQVEPAIEEAAFKLQKDEISGAVKTDDGYRVIKLTDRKEAKEATFEESKDEIRKNLVAQQVSELFEEWINEVESDAKITNKLSNTGNTVNGEADNGNSAS